jgi:hypothetical protein
MTRMGPVVPVRERLGPNARRIVAASSRSRRPSLPLLGVLALVALWCGGRLAAQDRAGDLGDRAAAVSISLRLVDEADGPVSGASVAVWTSSGGRDDTLTDGKADEDGRVDLRVALPFSGTVARGEDSVTPLVVRVDADGRRPVEQVVDAAPGDRLVLAPVVLWRGVERRGIVRAEGAPVAGATVWLERPPFPPFAAPDFVARPGADAEGVSMHAPRRAEVGAVARTGDDGAFVLVGAPEPALLCISAPGRRTRCRFVDAGEALDLGVVEAGPLDPLAVGGQPVPVEVRQVDGRPAAGAVLAFRASHEGWTSAVGLDADGRRAWRGPWCRRGDGVGLVGDLLVTLPSDPSQALFRSGLDVAAGSSLHLQLEPVETFEVLVRTRSGEPVADAAVTWEGEGWTVGPVAASEDGAVRLPTPPGAASIVVTAEGFGSSRSALFARGEIPVSLEVELAEDGPNAWIAGRVLDVRGQAVLGARVRLERVAVRDVVRPLRGGEGSAPGFLHASRAVGGGVVVDAEGRFALPMPPGSMLVHVVASAPGHAPTVSRVLRVDETSRRAGHDEVELKLVPGVSLSGTVLDGRGWPRPRAWVALSPGFGEPRVVRADAEGHFVFDAVGRGQHQLGRGAAGGWSRREFAEGLWRGESFPVGVADVRRDLVLEGYRARVRLVVDGQPAPTGWSVWLEEFDPFAEGGPRVIARARDGNAEGDYQIAADIGGALRLVARGPGGPGRPRIEVRQEVELTQGVDSEWQVELELAPFSGELPSKWIGRDGLELVRMMPFGTVHVGLEGVAVADDGSFSVAAAPSVGEGQLLLVAMRERGPPEVVTAFPLGR